MGRYLKNTEIDSGSYAVRLPVTDTSAVPIGQPDVPVNGAMRFDIASNSVQFYYSGTWNRIAKQGKTALTIDTFVGNGITTSFVMSQSESQNYDVLVFISGIFQAPTEHYSVSGNNLVFVEAPPTPDGYDSSNNIVVIHNLNSTP